MRKVAHRSDAHTRAIALSQQLLGGVSGCRGQRHAHSLVCTGYVILTIQCASRACRLLYPEYGGHAPKSIRDDGSARGVCAEGTMHAVVLAERVYPAMQTASLLSGSVVALMPGRCCLN